MADPRYRNGIFVGRRRDKLTHNLNNPLCFGWTAGPVNDLGCTTWTKEEFALFYFPGNDEAPAGWYQEQGEQVTHYGPIFANAHNYLFKPQEAAA